MAEEPSKKGTQGRKEKKEARKRNKQLVKEQKKARRAKGPRLKPCDLCHVNKDLLIRCIIDDTNKWHMVCGKCWKDVSGGVVDGDSNHPHYRYGGLWKAIR